jgi:hypothetical protein
MADRDRDRDHDRARDRDRDRDRETELLRVLTVETREELSKADAKAGLLLSCLGAALATVLAALDTGRLAPQHYSLLPRALFWTGSASSLAALILLGLAIAPRPGRPGRPLGHYFADVSAAASARSLTEVLGRTDLRDRDLHQILRLSRIVVIKYRCVQYGMVCSMAFLLLTGTALTLGAIGGPQ